MPAPSLRFAGGTATTVTFDTVNNDGAARNFLLELNRAQDFLSDDSIYMDFGQGAGAGQLTAAGLPNSTEWWARVFNKTDGAVSPTVLGSTAVTVANTAYAGFSVDKAAIVVPAAINDLAQAGQATLPGYPVSNLLLDSPGAMARFPTGASGVTFTTSGVPIDTVALLGTMMGDGAEYHLTGYADVGRTILAYDSGTRVFRCSPTIGRRGSYHMLHRMLVPSAAAFWNLNFYSPAPQLLLRHLIVGLARESTNASKGWSHGLNDLGSASRSRFGDPDRVLGWRGRTLDFELSWLREAEYQAKYADLPVLVGKTVPVLAIVNTKRNVFLQDRIAFGTITDWSAENVQSFRHTQRLTIDSLY